MMNYNKYNRGYYMPPEESLEWTKKEFIDHEKEELIKKLIDRWSMNENEDK